MTTIYEQMADEFCRWPLTPSSTLLPGHRYIGHNVLTHAEALAMFEQIVGPKIAALENENKEVRRERDEHIKYGQDRQRQWCSSECKPKIAALAAENVRLVKETESAQMKWHGARDELYRLREQAPVAWLITRYFGTGSNQHVKLELVMSPLTDDTFMDEGDEARPLYAAPPQAQETKR